MDIQFWKKNKTAEADKKRLLKRRSTPLPPGKYRIDYAMMLKGSVYKRRSGPVRQFGVTVGGCTRLVTSGDIVDRETYEALIAAGAIRAGSPDKDDPGPAPENARPKRKAV